MSSSERGGLNVQSAALASWFEPVVKAQDFFIRPDFNLGQFFYSAQTAGALADALDAYLHPCCLCTPRLAAEWQTRGRSVRLLDYDARFAKLAGYRRFDLLRPEPVGESFDVVIFDPIFVPAQQLRRALDLVVGSERIGATDVFMTFPVDREAELSEAFQPYGLQRTAFPLHYNNVKANAGPLFVLYGTRPL